MNNKKIDLFEDNELKIYSERNRKPEECKLPSDILVPVKDKLINTINTSEDTAISHNPFLSYAGPIVLPDYLLDKVISVIGLDQRPSTTGVHREK